MIRVSIDASVDGQFGVAGIGILWIENGQQRQIAIPLMHKMDNHEAEFWALHQLLTLIIQEEKTAELIICHTDSKVVYEAVQKRFHKRDPYKQILGQILTLLEQVPQFNLQWVSDQQNKGADRLARQAMRKMRGR